MIRKFLKFTGLIVLAVVLLGSAGYYALFKPDMELQKELKAEFGEELFEINDTVDGTAASSGQNNAPAPPDNVSQKDTIMQKVVGEIEKMTRTVSKMVSGKADETQPVPVTASPDNADKQAAPVRLTQAEITEKYAPRFQSLQNQSAGRLETFYSSGLAERQALKANGTFNREEMARKIYSGKLNG